MCYARVGEQPLDVSLSQSNQVPDDHRNRRQPPDRLVPDVDQRRECFQPETKECGERGTLHCRRHISGDRCWRSFISVGRPHVERGRGYLEAEADQDQRDADEQQAVVLEAEAEDAALDLDEVRRAGGTVDQRCPVQKERRRESTKQKVFDRSFRRTFGAPIDAYEHVNSNRHQLDPEEHYDQVTRRGENHHSRSRQQQQHVRLTGSDSLAHVVVEGHGNRAQRGDQQNLVGRPTEVVDGDRTDGRCVSSVCVVANGHHREDAECHAKEADAALMLIALAAPTRVKKKQHCAAHQQQIGSECRSELSRHAQIKLHQRPASLTCATPPTLRARSTTCCADVSIRRNTGAG